MTTTSDNRGWVAVWLRWLGDDLHNAATRVELVWRLRFAFLISCFILNACGGDSTGKTGTTTSADRPVRAATILHIPKQFRTIQTAVDASIPGDIIQVAAGVYKEAVTIETPSITVRGEDRNEVILDGSFKKDNGIFVAADDVVLENLTVRNYTVNGVFVTGNGDPDNPPGTDTASTTRRHYRMSYLTAHNNGLYGLYAFGAQDGVIEHVYTSANPDSGIYVGQCNPCRTLVRDATAEHNSIGFETTNAGGDFAVIESNFSHNRIGATLTSQTAEMLAPQSGVTDFVGNVLAANQDPDSPQTSGAFGVGLAIAGGNGNRVTRNLIRNNNSAGLVVTDIDGFAPSRNCVEENQFAANGIDLAMRLSGTKPFDGKTNGFQANTFTTSDPANIETAYPCGAVGPGATLARSAPGTQPPSADWRKIAAPPAQPNMPPPPAGKRVPAKGQATTLDLSTITTPSN